MAWDSINETLYCGYRDSSRDGGAEKRDRDIPGIFSSIWLWNFKTDTED